jgi:glycosyltransferase involved in cell wall biosynthesis
MSRPESFEVHNRFISAEERDTMFRQASLVALPYVEATQSGVIPVAYSYAKPVVATRVGALNDAVEDGTTGRLVPPRDVRSLAAAIVELLCDPAERQAMGRAGRRKLEAEWSPRAVAQQAIEVYRAAIRDRKQVATPARASDPVEVEPTERAPESQPQPMSASFIGN